MNLMREQIKTVRILVPNSWTSNQKGEFLEELASKLLKRLRYNVKERVRFTGMEIDVVADNIDTQQRAFVECKFVRDLLSANVIDLLLGKALRKGVDIVYLFSTAYPGKEAKGVIDEIQQNPPESSPKFAFVGPNQIAGMFADIFNFEPFLPERLESSSIASNTLIITPQLPPFWILEEHQDGIPHRAIIQFQSTTSESYFSKVKELLEEHGIYQGLELSLVGTPVQETCLVDNQESDEVVTLVAMADSLDDYRPCRPQDFVGRYDIQKSIWDLLVGVREGNTNTRILALSGPSGFGKSSIVIKLTDRFRNKKWANKFYLFPVDVRSARGPLFVAKALKTAFQTAINDGFISSPLNTITIESTETFMQSQSVQTALEALQDSKRVMIVFFDQFEELFTKDELISTFDAFKRLVFETSSICANLVIGFSWRTGITLSDDNPAYHLWHELKDLRADIVIDKFTSADSSKLIGQFEKALSKKLLPPLRRRLLEQGQGLPWLLKKLCIHIYREINKGTNQEELLSRRLNIRALFDEDLEPLTEHQTQCLRYIASNSPVDMLDVFEHFDQTVVDCLYNNRLIIRAGPKYVVYWDIFRDYLVEGGVPAIPWTYVPSVQFSMAIRAFLLLRENHSLDLITFAQRLGYAESTVGNIVSDLQNFLLASRDIEGQYHARPELVEVEIETIANFVKKQLREHVIIQAFYGIVAPGEGMSIEEFRNIIMTSYAAANLTPNTVTVYTTRLKPWFLFAGLLDGSEEQVLRPREIGSEFGRFVAVRSRSSRIGLSFMCSSSPEKVIMLARKLAEDGEIIRNEILKFKNRNAASDLSSLGLATWHGGILFPEQILIEAFETSSVGIHDLVQTRALETRFLKALIMLFESKPSKTVLEVGKELATKLDREWKDNSATRYASAGRRWLRFFDILEITSTI